MTVAPTLVVLAHGTNDSAGRATWGRVTVAVRSRLTGVDVRLAYAGVARPALADVLPPGPVVVVPCFLAAGFHVRVDVPGQLAELGRDDVVLSDPLGPDPALLDVALARLREAGATPDDTVVLAAAGSTDPVAQADLDTASSMMAARLGREVPVGYIAGGEPRLGDVVAACPGRVALVTWLLAPGVFHRWMESAGASMIADPLGDHPGVVDVIAARYRSAAPPSVPGLSAMGHR